MFLVASQSELKLGVKMAKKSKRQVSKRSTRVTAQRSVEFNPDYSDVKKDLRTIGSLAGFFVFVLIVLSFFLR